ncbi:MAG: hypothetical protein ACOYVK_07760 [Bacillota bacterium]
MSNSFVDIQGDELESFIRHIERHKGIRMFVNNLAKNKRIQSQEYTVLKAERCNIEDLKLSFFVLGLQDDKVKIVYVETEGEYSIYASCIEEENGKEIMKGYQLYNHGIKHIITRDYDAQFKKDLQTLKEQETQTKKRSASKEGIPCIYGNWCGPGCSGPGDPISPVDACCKEHDLCYGEKGYFNRSCDDALVDCLAPYVVQGDKWAIIISKWFKRKRK